MEEDISTSVEMTAVVGSMSWWLVLIWGIMALIVGLMLVTTPLATAFTLILFIGVYWLIGGIFTLASLFTDRSNWGWKTFLAVISIIAGIGIMSYPIYSSILVMTVFTTLIGFWGLLIGCTKLFEAFVKKDVGAGVLGLLSVIFGFILLAYPYAGAIALPFIAGIFAILVGISTIFVSYIIKKAQASL
jgi:uncharacterized membrane protein HdeD (DUF308 family)